MYIINSGVPMVLLSVAASIDSSEATVASAPRVSLYAWN